MLIVIYNVECVRLLVFKLSLKFVEEVESNKERSQPQYKTEICKLLRQKKSLEREARKLDFFLKIANRSS